MEVDGSSSQPSPPYGLATPVAPPQPLPPSFLQNITDALKDMKVKDSFLSQPSPSHGSSAAVAPPPAGVLSFPPPAPAPQPPAAVAPPQPPPSFSQQNNTDAVENMEVEDSSLSQHSPPHGLSAAVAPPLPRAPLSSLQNIADALQDMKLEDRSSSQPSSPDGLATPVAPPQPPPSSSQQNIADALQDMKLEDSSSSQLPPPQSQTPPLAPPSLSQSRKRRAPSPLQQNNGVRDEMEPKPKRAKLCLTASDLKAQPSPPSGLSATVAPPLPQTPPSSQQKNADVVEDMKVNDRSLSQLPPPQGQTPPLAPPSLPPSRKRRAPSPLQQNNGVRDEMEPKPKKARLFGPLDEVTPPQASSSSQQNKADAGEVDSSSVSHQPIQQVPVSPPPQRRCLKRPAPCTAQELSEDMVSPSKKARLNGLI
ncbi:uncharacterized protein [Misgurnus anguillicaudatus]|uniref:uncharacterized protein isoform X2 n=1 Tax=Misgurnus anguillicaudatus TaxID=75329 RepID=UPI003CCF309F